MAIFHDREWGVPVHDDRTHFEFLVLGGAQAGLSWSAILNKREGYRRAFVDFDADAIARFTEKRVAKLVADPAIIRNRRKIDCAVSNARAFVRLRDELGSYDKYVWGFVDGKPIVNRRKRVSQIPATSRQSDALSADLSRRGFKFVGSTIMYATLQACGLINDHLVSCPRWREVQLGSKARVRR